MKNHQLHELLYQALETEQGGIEIYQTAIRCALNEDLKKEWEEYLEQTERHEAVLRTLLDELKLDADTETPGREVVRHIGTSLVKAMEMALNGNGIESHRRLKQLQEPPVFARSESSPSSRRLTDETSTESRGSRTPSQIVRSSRT